MLTHEILQPACLPRIPVGTPIKQYLGILPADDATEAKYQVLGVRLTPENAEDNDFGGLNLYPNGWEYFVGAVDGSNFTRYGWIKESELMEKGYGEPQTDELLELVS